MTSPFFSIIIPVYNKERYIQKCVDSIIAQSFIDFEVIVINDGSNDKSKAILNVINDPHFQIFTIPNGGVSNARNVGLRNAKGQYVLFIDADDNIDNDYLASIHKAIIQDEAELLIFGLTKIYQDASSKRIIPSGYGVVSFEEFKDSFLLEFQRLEGLYGYICNKAVKRTIITENNLKFDTSLKLAEDLDFWVSIYTKRPRIAFSQYAGYNYIQDVAGSSTFYECDPWPIIQIWLKIYDFLSPCNISNASILQKKLWDLFRVALLECKSISLKNINVIIKDTIKIRKAYSLINDYKPSDFLGMQLKNNNKLNIYLYLKARQTYHLLRKWLK